MEYVNGDGHNLPIEILTEDGVRALAEHEGELPRDIGVAHHIEGIGSTYRVEDVLRQWPGGLTYDEKIDQRLRSLRRGIDRQFNPLGVGQAMIPS